MVGKASLIVIIGFSLIFGIAGQYWNRTGNNAVQNFVSYYNQEEAHNLASIGANLACDSIIVNPTKDTSMAFTFFDGKDSCRITAHQNIKAGNRDDSVKVISYYVDGSAPMTDTTIVWLQPQGFAGFAMFTQNENGVNWITGDQVTGPFATNGTMVIDGAPIFRGRATAVGGISVGSAGNHAQFLGGYQSGSSVKVNVPTDLSLTEQGATSASTFTPGSYTGSKYAYDVYPTFNSDGTVTYNTKTQQYNSSTQKWTTVNTVAATTVAISSLANSYGFTVILVKNGDVHVQGTLNGSVTVVADTAAGSSADISYTASTTAGTELGSLNSVKTSSSANGNVIIEGNLLYNGNPTNSPTSNGTDMLGLVAGNSVVLDNQTSASGVQIDAAIFARLGSWGYLDYDGSINGFPTKPGTLNLLGSISQNTRGPVGTANSDGTVKTGYVKNYVFDPRFLNESPPYYPMAVNQFTVISWYE